MILLAISIGWKVVVLTLGSAVPRWVIGDGLDLIPADSRAYAEEAKLTAMSLWDHPLERLGIVRAIRVTRVDSVGDPGHRQQFGQAYRRAPSRMSQPERDGGRVHLLRDPLFAGAHRLQHRGGRIPGLSAPLLA